MDFQCFKREIDLKIQDFVIFAQNLCLAKCIFGIVLFVQPFILSIYEFLMFQMAN